MSPLWFAQTIVGALIGAAITWIVFGVMAWGWGRRKLIPFLHKHAPMLAAMFEERDE